MNKANTIHAETYQEDLEHQLEQGLITEEEYNRLLKEYPDNCEEKL